MCHVALVTFHPGNAIPRSVKASGVCLQRRPRASANHTGSEKRHHVEIGTDKDHTNTACGAQRETETGDRERERVRHDSSVLVLF